MCFLPAHSPNWPAAAAGAARRASAVQTTTLLRPRYVQRRQLKRAPLCRLFHLIIISAYLSSSLPIEHSIQLQARPPIEVAASLPPVSFPAPLSSSSLAAPAEAKHGELNRRHELLRPAAAPRRRASTARVSRERGVPAGRLPSGRVPAAWAGAGLPSPGISAAAGVPAAAGGLSAAARVPAAGIPPSVRAAAAAAAAEQRPLLHGGMVRD